MGVSGLRRHESDLNSNYLFYLFVDRMCNMAGILAQFKNMAGGDYASVADNLTRELMVIFIESPEDRKTIQQIYEAGKCAKKVADESGLLDEQKDADIDNQEDQDFWNEF